jgi:hypothetical protein
MTNQEIFAYLLTAVFYLPANEANTTNENDTTKKPDIDNLKYTNKLGIADFDE